jgi:hypothetical protein
MSVTKVQLVSNISGNVSGGASFTGIVTAAEYDIAVKHKYLNCGGLHVGVQQQPHWKLDTGLTISEVS